jgi:hypothetical protein
MQTFKERLKERALALGGGDPDLADRLDRSLALATDLLKAEGGDPKVVFAALLLQKVDQEQARSILTELETEAEIAQDILAVHRRNPEPANINEQVFQDVLALLDRKAGGAAPLHTRTAQKLAESH